MCFTPRKPHLFVFLRRRNWSFWAFWSSNRKWLALDGVGIPWQFDLRTVELESRTDEAGKNESKRRITNSLAFWPRGPREEMSTSVSARPKNDKRQETFTFGVSMPLFLQNCAIVLPISDIVLVSKRYSAKGNRWLPIANRSIQSIETNWNMLTALSSEWISQFNWTI